MAWLILLARYVLPPRSGCIFCIKWRCALIISSFVAPAGNSSMASASEVVIFPFGCAVCCLLFPSWYSLSAFFGLLCEELKKCRCKCCWIKGKNRMSNGVILRRPAANPAKATPSQCILPVAAMAAMTIIKMIKPHFVFSEFDKPGHFFKKSNAPEMASMERMSRCMCVYGCSVNMRFWDNLLKSRGRSRVTKVCA